MKSLKSMLKAAPIQSHQYWGFNIFGIEWLGSYDNWKLQHFTLISLAILFPDFKNHKCVDWWNPKKATLVDFDFTNLHFRPTLYIRHGFRFASFSPSVNNNKKFQSELFLKKYMQLKITFHIMVSTERNTSFLWVVTLNSMYKKQFIR